MQRTNTARLSHCTATAPGTRHAQGQMQNTTSAAPTPRRSYAGVVVGKYAESPEPFAARRAGHSRLPVPDGPPDTPSTTNGSVCILDASRGEVRQQSYAQGMLLGITWTQDLTCPTRPGFLEPWAPGPLLPQGCWRQPAARPRASWVWLAKTKPLPGAPTHSERSSTESEWTSTIPQLLSTASHSQSSLLCPALDTAQQAPATDWSERNTSRLARWSTHVRTGLNAQKSMAKGREVMSTEVRLPTTLPDARRTPAAAHLPARDALPSQAVPPYAPSEVAHRAPAFDNSPRYPPGLPIQISTKKVGTRREEVERKPRRTLRARVRPPAPLDMQLVRLAEGPPGLVPKRYVVIVDDGETGEEG